MTDPSRRPNLDTAAIEALPLDEQDLAADPLRQLELWLREARDAEAFEWNAMTLSTVDTDGAPDARIVLLRGVDESGIHFYSNYESEKGRQLAAEPRAAAVLFWPELGRQVRIAGSTARLSPELSDAYYANRPRESRLGAWASPQSRPIASRAELERQLAEVRERFRDRDPDRPPFWGGYRLDPRRVEFWKIRPFRLHDRFRYTRDGATWTRERLAP